MQLEQLPKEIIELIFEDSLLMSFASKKMRLIFNRLYLPKRIWFNGVKLNNLFEINLQEYITRQPSMSLVDMFIDLYPNSDEMLLLCLKLIDYPNFEFIKPFSEKYPDLYKKYILEIINDLYNEKNRKECLEKLKKTYPTLYSVTAGFRNFNK